MATNQAQVDEERVRQEERNSIEAYLQKHDVVGIMQSLTERILSDRPVTTPKEHFAHLLRMDLMREKMGSHLTDQEIFEESKASEVPGRLLVNLFEATKNITAEIVPKETIDIIIQETLELLHCDRVSLFVYDSRIGMLVLNASNLEVPIRVKPGQGIVGASFQKQELVNIYDCYKDSRFDTSFDHKTGYRTNNLICHPIVDFAGDCMGVLQAINKEGADHFNRIDEILMENLTQHCSIALRNAEVYRAAIVTSERATALLNMIQSLSQDLGVQSTVLTVTMHANELVQADRCTVFLVDEKKQQLWSIIAQTGKEIRIPKNAGIAGECATEGKLIVIDDAYNDPRFNQAIDKKTGYHTQSILAVPVLRRVTNTHNDNRVLAVIQMINKMEFDGAVGRFDEEDVQVMETFSTFVASKLEGQNTSGSQQDAPDNEAGAAFEGIKPTHTPRGQGDDNMGHLKGQMAIRACVQECDEEDEDDDDFS